MVCFKGGAGEQAEYVPTSAPLFKYVLRPSGAQGIEPDTRLSDHASFWDRNIPALMVTDTAYFRNRNYHGPDDRADTLDYAFMAQLVKSLKSALGELPPPAQ